VLQELKRLLRGGVCGADLLASLTARKFHQTSWNVVAGRDGDSWYARQTQTAALVVRAEYDRTA